ncbi:MAG: PEP-CTERM sorting domain-containing protein [Akkermansiaceae bacterium]
MNYNTFFGGITALIAVSPLHAALIYNESFDYGGTTGNLDAVSSWGSASTFNDYVHDGGLDVAGMNGETGGAWFAERPGGNLTASLSTSTIDLSTISAGETIWAGVIFDYKTGGGTHSLSFGGGSVSGLGFLINAAGDVSVSASNNGGATSTNDTGVDATDGTYFLLLRATKGTGTSPTNSVVDFWFNPTDASSVGALGSADWTTGADSKWGRDSQTMSGISGLNSSGGSMDEIRLGNDLVDVVGVVPEPSTTTLLGLGGLALILRRRK